MIGAVFDALFKAITGVDTKWGDLSDFTFYISFLLYPLLALVKKIVCVANNPFLCGTHTELNIKPY